MRTVLRVVVIGVGGVVAKREFRVDSVVHDPLSTRTITHELTKFSNARLLA